MAKPQNIQPGLTKFWFCEKSAFSNIATHNPNSQIIYGNHTFPAGEGWKTAYILKDKHTGKGTTIGTKGAAVVKMEMEVFLPGIDDATLSFVKRAINDEFITLHKDSDCEYPLVYQLGDECVGATVTCDLSIGTIEPNGEKGFTLKFSYNNLLWIYPGVITPQPNVSLSFTYNP